MVADAAVELRLHEEQRRRRPGGVRQERGSPPQRGERQDGRGEDDGRKDGDGRARDGQGVAVPEVVGGARQGCVGPPEGRERPGPGDRVSPPVDAAYFCVADWRHPFSRARDAAELIRAKGLAERYVVADKDAQTSPLTAYLHKKFYYQRAGREGTFVVWDKAWRTWPDQNLLETARRKAAERGEQVLVVSNYPLEPGGTAAPVGKLTGSIVADEDYYLYLVDPQQPGREIWQTR